MEGEIKHRAPKYGATCRVPGCEEPSEPHGCTGLCAPHIAQRARGGSLGPIVAPPAIIIEGGVARVPLAGRRSKEPVGWALIDAADVPLVADVPWSLSKGYAYARWPGEAVPRAMHRVILGLTDPADEVDHIHGDTLDNRRSELRVVTRTGNAQNVVKAGRPADMRNVYWNRQQGRWNVRIGTGRKLLYLGSFSDVEEAKAAAREGRARHLPFANEARHTPDQPRT